ncbi:MAG: hypothetical protein Kow0032_24350 [Methyloligellaceae bacterium]
MTADRQSGDETIPGTVFTPRQVGRLKVAVIVMGIALVGGFGLVMGTIVYQASQLGKSAPREAAARDRVAGGVNSAALLLEPGQRIARIALDGDRLAVHVTGSAGEEIRVIDLVSGALVARLPVRTE